jgi:hypothetical protein
VWILLRLRMSGAACLFPIRLHDEQKENYLPTTIMLNLTSFQFYFTSFFMFFLTVTPFISVLLCSSSENYTHILLACGLNSSPFMPEIFVLS